MVSHTSQKNVIFIINNDIDKCLNIHVGLYEQSAVYKFVRIADECIDFICTIRFPFCLVFFGQYGHWNWGSLPHSCLLCRSMFDLHLYNFPQLGQLWASWSELDCVTILIDWTWGGSSFKKASSYVGTCRESESPSKSP